MNRKYTLALAALLLLPLLTACGGEKKLLKVIHAGSLTKPFKALAEAFEKRNPTVRVLLEHHGSRACARQILLGRRYDVFGSADYKVIDNLLRPDHTAFNVRFCTNEMALAYTDQSRGADRIDQHNWFKVLQEKEVAAGRSDPNLDPCGYRAVMTCQLAEIHYKQPGLAKAILDKDGKRYISPKETAMLGQLEAGELDYIFIYRSVAEQHGLKTLLLPDRINLKTARFADYYKQAKVSISGKKGKDGKAGDQIERVGAPMVYGVTIPNTAESPSLAAKFLVLLLGPEGRKLMERHGQPAISPARPDGKLPAELRPFCGTSK